MGVFTNSSSLGLNLIFRSKKPVAARTRILYFSSEYINSSAVLKSNLYSISRHLSLCYKGTSSHTNCYNIYYRTCFVDSILLRPSPPSWMRCMSAGVGKRRRTHYYDVLGLTSKASQKQIKAAYYDLSKKYHPDVANDKRSHVMFTEISEAYEVLGNIPKRRMYDRGMFNQRDPRVHDEGDYTQSYREKTSQSPFERGDRPPPPTGRSKIYNFDEFYKQHYNEMRERRTQEYKDFQHFKEMNEFNTRPPQSRMSSSLLMSLCLTLLVITVILNDRMYDYDRVKRDEDKKD